jgi:hypothetical protein
MKQGRRQGEPPRAQSWTSTLNDPLLRDVVPVALSSSDLYPALAISDSLDIAGPLTMLFRSSSGMLSLPRRLEHAQALNWLHCAVHRMTTDLDLRPATLNPHGR